MKVAVITGAASGIGLALTQVYLQKGNLVLMVDNDETKLKTQAHSLQVDYPDQVLHKTCDVRQIEEVNALARYVKETLGRVDWLYNNAGIIGRLGPVWELDIQTIHAVMDVNVYGMIHLIQAFMPLLLNQQTPSHIINMASLYALCAGSQTAAYSMSKHAVLALSESLYFDLKPLEKPINISVVFPSFTDTGLLSTPTLSSDPFHESLRDVLTHCRSALDVALHVMNAVEKNQFYIFPDKEVKGYHDARSQSLINQENPHLNSIEKLMNSLRKRTCKP